MLLKMYLKWAERRGFKREVIDFQDGEEAGIKSATVTVHGRVRVRADVAQKRACTGWCGSRRSIRRRGVIRRSPRSSSGPSFPRTSTSQIEDKDLRIDTYRSSGAGGQHVNVTDSAVRITHLPTGIVVSCQNERSQIKNRAQAMKVLKARLFDRKMKEQQAKLEQIGGEKRDIAFGNQIRSYVLQPYQMVKDLRTRYEVGDPSRVLDGDLDPFIKAYLLQKAKGTLGAPVAAEDDE